MSQRKRDGTRASSRRDAGRRRMTSRHRQVTLKHMEAEYRAMAKDWRRESEALEWVEATHGDAMDWEC